VLDLPLWFSRWKITLKATKIEVKIFTLRNNYVNLEYKLTTKKSNGTARITLRQKSNLKNAHQ